MAKKVAKGLRYFGTVQGVGFRRSTENLARGFAVSGFVRNLPDGSVHIHVEGAPAVVEQFLARIREKMGALITEARVEPAVVEDFPKFSIQR